MNAPDDPTSLTQQPSAGAHITAYVRDIFAGPHGMRAGWRFLIFAALLLCLQGVARLIVSRVPGLALLLRSAETGTLTPAFGMVFEPISILTVFLAAFIMSRIEKRDFGSYGIPRKGTFGKLFWQGVLGGLLLETIEILLISALGGFSFGGLALAGSVLLKYAVLWAFVFVLVGINEEFTFRGYAQFTLTTGVGFWPSAVLLSALFGATHLGNPHEGWVGALSVLMFGLFACFTLKRTGNLWFAIGFHAAADYAETFIYSVPDSGLAATGHLLNSTIHGPRWLTGGSIGPEGSIFVFLVLGLAFPLFAWLYPAKPEPLTSSEQFLPDTIR